MGCKCCTRMIWEKQSWLRQSLIWYSTLSLEFYDMMELDL